jgi:hypothetical protein
VACQDLGLALGSLGELAFEGCGDTGLKRSSRLAQQRPGGGISLDGTRWIGCRPKYLLPVKVLSRLFRRLKLEMLLAAHDTGRLQFFGDHALRGPG